MALPSRRPLTPLGLMSGLADSTRAAAPAGMAEAKDVPEPTKLAVPTTAWGLARAMVEPGSSRLTTERPGATRSGLSQPSNSVGPTEEKAQAAHLAGADELL